MPTIRRVIKKCGCPCATGYDPCGCSVPLACGIECVSSGTNDETNCGPFFPGVTAGAGTNCSAVNTNCLGNPEGDPGMVTQTVQYRINCIGLTIGQWYRIDYTLAGSPTQYFFLATAASESTPLDTVPFPAFPGENSVYGATICAVPGSGAPCP